MDRQSDGAALEAANQQDAAEEAGGSPTQKGPSLSLSLPRSYEENAFRLMEKELSEAKKERTKAIEDGEAAVRLAQSLGRELDEMRREYRESSRTRPRRFRETRTTPLRPQQRSTLPPQSASYAAAVARFPALKQELFSLFHQRIHFRPVQKKAGAFQAINAALHAAKEAAGGLLGSVSDHVQAKRKGGDNEAAYGEPHPRSRQDAPQLDLPIRFQKESRPAHKQSFSSLQQPVGADHTPPPTPPEPRVDGDFDRQAKARCTAEDHEPERCRVAALCLPSLLNRCAAVIKTYVADAPLRGKMPFPRSSSLPACAKEPSGPALNRNRSTLSLRLFFGSTPLSLFQPSSARRSSARPLRTSLYELHPLFTALLSLSNSSPSIVSAYGPYRRIVGIRDDSGEEPSLEGLPTGFQVKRVGGKSPKATWSSSCWHAAARKWATTRIGAGGSF
ncbi:hypothetical protein JCM1840_006836 [Sporobolomyces johnsonii]